jgi:origin recognition complex subunit 2
VVPGETGLTYLQAVRPSAARTTRATLAADSELPPPHVLAGAVARLPERWVDEHKGVRAAVSVGAVWRYEWLIGAGHSLLFYGLGSKREVLERIAGELALGGGEGRERAVVVVDGFCPALTVRAVLLQAAAAVIPPGTEHAKRHVLDYVRAIDGALAAVDDEDRVGDGGGGGDRAHLASSLVLVVHNIDGGALRSPDAQNVLSALAEIPRVALVASIDHANAPLLWDGATYGRFGWAWQEVTTYARYTHEMAFTSRPLLRGAEETRVEAAVVLLNSLSPNARKLFRLLAEMQAGTDARGGGRGGDGDGAAAAADRPEKRARVAGWGDRRTTFLDLSARCRDEYLPSDPASVRAFLTELQTHELLDRRKGADAAERLWIPLSAEQLATVVRSVDGGD